MIINDEEKLALATCRKILSGEAAGKGNLVPVLQKIQGELGYIPPVAMEELSRHMNLPAVDIYSVVTFFCQFRLTPPGKNRIKVCMGTACHIKGGGIILESWERRLGIKEGETTADWEFDLERVACVGCCSMAPVTLWGDTVHGKVSPTKVDGLLFAHQLNNEKEGGN